MQENILINKVKRWMKYTAPNSGTALAMFRIAVGVTAMIHVIVFYNYAPFLYGEYAVINPEINRTIRDVFGGYFVNVDVYSFTSLVTEHTSLSEPAAIKLLLSIYLLVLLSLTTGNLTTLSALLAWLMNLMLLNSYQLASYGYDMFLSNCLLLCVLTPVNYKFSLDKHWNRIKKNEFAAGFSISIIKLYLCFIYFFSGINKMVSEQWWNGESVWRALMQPPFLSFDAGFLADQPAVLATAAIFTLITETCYPVLLYIKKTRKLIIMLAIALHLGIAICLGLWFFSAIMIILNLTVFIAHRPINYEEARPNIQTRYHLCSTQ